MVYPISIPLFTEFRWYLIVPNWCRISSIPSMEHCFDKQLKGPLIFSILDLQFRTLKIFWSVVWVSASYRDKTSHEGNLHNGIGNPFKIKPNPQKNQVLLRHQVLSQVGVEEIYLFITVGDHILHIHLRAVTRRGGNLNFIEFNGYILWI